MLLSFPLEYFREQTIKDEEKFLKMAKKMLHIVHQMKLVINIRIYFIYIENYFDEFPLFNDIFLTF